MDVVVYIIAGAVVGFTVGFTGVGGGSLMTPLLIFLGVPYHVAIGTDLFYAAITKSSGMVLHARKKNIEWQGVLYLAMGSLPASIATAWSLNYVFQDPEQYQAILTRSLGMMLVLTSLVIVFKRSGSSLSENDFSDANQQATLGYKKKLILVLSGLFLGVFVTLTSVGAGALCAALLLWLYPHMPALRVLGTDISHAVPLTLVAGLGHFFWLGNVDFVLLAYLLLGSLPAIHIAIRLASHVPGHRLQRLIAFILLIIGVRFALF